MQGQALCSPHKKNKKKHPKKKSNKPKPYIRPKKKQKK